MIAALATVFVLAPPNLQYPIGRDQATYCVIAEGLLKSKHLYRDLWDNKPPGIFYLYVPIVKLLGRAMWLVGAVDLVCVMRGTADKSVRVNAVICPSTCFLLGVNLFIARTILNVEPAGEAC